MLRSMGERERSPHPPHLPSYITAPTLKHTHPFDITLILSMEQEKSHYIVMGRDFYKVWRVLRDFVALNSIYTVSHCITTKITV